MTARRVVTGRTPGDAELAAAVARKAQQLGENAANPITPGRVRAEHVRRLRAAWEALRPGVWSQPTALCAAVKVLDHTRAMMRKDGNGLALATKRATNALAGVLADRWAPAGLAGGNVPADLVEACLASQSRGRPKGDRVGEVAAYRRLLFRLSLTTARTPRAFAPALRLARKRATVRAPA